MPTTPTSIAYYHDIDLVKNQLINAKLHPITSVDRIAMASSLNSNDKGLTVFDITENYFYVWEGNQWLIVRGVTEDQIEFIQEAYATSVIGVDVSQTTTERTVSLHLRDDSYLNDTYKFSHVHDQTVASAEWIITHNLGKFPAVTIVDSADEEVVGEVRYTNANSLTVTFSAAFSGKAYLN